ncbi:DUF262 domain-containing protein [Streptomyces albogriseolus]|uniref:DUF262 domain-containing protein n=1 Tax=Streptomyces albogriseolus TaxID=1887 RepID=UPI0036C5E439
MSHAGGDANMASTSDEEAEQTVILDPEQDEDEDDVNVLVDIEVEVGPPSAEEALRYFGVDFDVDGLVRRFKQKEIIVPRFDPEEPENSGTGYAGFQRNFVWKKRQMDRFVESILLGYPVPGIFLVELPNRRYIVLDGQQRLTTLRDFFNGTYEAKNGERPFALDYAAPPFQGQTYATLQPADRRLLNNALIQATVALPIGENGKLAVYTLFERINSGGTKLNEQQIRVAIFPGSATQLVRRLNRDSNWRQLFGNVHRDLKDQELILRYLALKRVAAEETDPKGEPVQYRAPMATFMSQYLSDNEDMSEEKIEEEERDFAAACRLLVEAVGANALKRNRTINAARADSVLVGLSLAVREDPTINALKVRSAMAELEANNDYVEKTQKSTSHKLSVTGRLSAAISAFTGRQ